MTRSPTLPCAIWVRARSGNSGENGALARPPVGMDHVTEVGDVKDGLIMKKCQIDIIFLK